MEMLIAMGVIAAIGGAATSFMGGQDANSANHEILEGQQRLEAQNELQMNLDTQRRQRALIRQSQASRSQALSVATNQGAGGGSGLAGAYGGISGTVNNAERDTNQNFQIGSAKFGINRDITAAQGRLADAQTLEGIGSGLTSLGGALVSNAGSISKIGKYFG